MSKRSGAREQSEQGGTSKRLSGAIEPANGRASDPVLTSRFLAIQVIGRVNASACPTATSQQHLPCQKYEEPLIDGCFGFYLNSTIIQSVPVKYSFTVIL